MRKTSFMNGESGKGPHGDSKVHEWGNQQKEGTSKVVCGA